MKLLERDRLFAWTPIEAYRRSSTQSSYPTQHGYPELSSTRYVASVGLYPASLIKRYISLIIKYAPMVSLSREDYWMHHSHTCLAGALVEVAPNKLACASSDAVKTIYGSHEWKKSHFYSDFADFNGTPSLCSETDPIRATILRRRLLPAFSRANLAAMSKNIFMHLEKFISKLEEFERQGRPLDTYRWFRYLTFEVVSVWPINISHLSESIRWLILD